MFEDGSGKTRNAVELRAAAKYVVYTSIFNFDASHYCPQTKTSIRLRVMEEELCIILKYPCHCGLENSVCVH